MDDAAAGKIRRYRIAETRLPFVNAEIAQVEFQGLPHLVSSTWGGKSGGRLYFWNPDTGSHDFRELPDKIPGAYMLRTGPDGRLYLGGGRGELVRYDPQSDTFDVLVADELHAITWGGCVTDRYVVWSASPGEAAVYDWRNEKLIKVFRPMDTLSPTALYGHCVHELPDGKVLVAMDVPQMRLIVLDLDTMTARSHTPEAVADCSAVIGTSMVDDRTIGFFRDEEFCLVEYPGFELLAKVPQPPGDHHVSCKWVRLGDDCYAQSNSDGALFKLDRDEGKWDQLTDGSDTGRCTLGTWLDRDVCWVSTCGMATRFSPQTGKSDTLDLEAVGLLPAHGLCAVPSANVIVGAPFINQRFWTIDLDTGEGRDCGRAAPGGGQVNQIIWDPTTRRALLSSYTSCTVTAFDPSKPAHWPDNPRVLASARDHEQMRPTALAHDGRHVWMATSPRYGHLGGALCRIDPGSGEIKVWRHIIEDQKINAIVLDTDRRRVYFSSEIFADCGSAPPTQSTAMVGSFDMDQLTLLRSQAVKADAPVVKVLALLGGGEVLVAESADLYAWNPQEGQLRKLDGEIDALREVINLPSGDMLASTSRAIGLLALDGNSLTFRKLIDEGGAYMHVAGEMLFYAREQEVCSIALADLGI
ncbi:MAG: hypothetical protein J7M14_01125 [Planctomycetes bacterium]|nr:hypothetical protein [Planctomycetota bacterium]